MRTALRFSFICQFGRLFTGLFMALAGVLALAQPNLTVSGSINPNGFAVNNLFTWTSPMTIAGTGWVPGETVGIILFGPINSIGVSPTVRAIGSLVANGSGGIGGTINIPYDEDGPFTILRPGYYEVRGTSATAVDLTPPRINVCPATYKEDGVGIDWSHDRGGRDGGVENIKRVFPHWMATWDEKPVGIYARASHTDTNGGNQPAYITHTDFPGDHYAHDYNLLMVPEDEYRWVMGTANYYEIEDGQAGREIGRMELEWETLNNGNPNSYGFGVIGFPLFAHPTVGDRVYTVGRWILDAGHPEKGDRTEVHPARMIATMRGRPTVMPLSEEHSDCMTYARQVDIYVSGHGGGSNRNFYSLSDGLGSGGRIKDVISGSELSDYYENLIGPSGLDVPYFSALGGYSRAAEEQPINDMNYEFDMDLPAPPNGATAVQVQVINQINHSTAVNEVITYTDEVDGLPTKAHIVLPYLGADNGIYSRTLKFSWNTFKAPGKHFKIRLDSVLVKDDSDDFPLSDGEWQLWCDVSGQWLSLTQRDAESFFDCSDDQEIGLGGPTFDVYVDPDDPLYVHAYGYEEDAVEDLFSTGFGWDSLAAVFNIGLTVLNPDEHADNDQLGGALFILDNPSKTNGPGGYDLASTPAALDDNDSHYNLRFNVSYIPSAPRIEVNGVPSEHGNVCIGEWVDRKVEIFNIGEEDLDVNKITVTGEGYTLLPTPAVPFTVAGGGHVNVTVRFSPTAPGQGDGEIEFESTDPCQPKIKFDLHGTATYPVGSLSGYLDFGQMPVDDRTVGHQRVINFLINNTGECELVVNSATIAAGSSPGFAMGPPPVFPQTIQPGGSLEVPVIFNPGTLGLKTATIEVDLANDPTHPDPLTISASGTGIVPTISSTPPSTIFAPTVLNTSRSQTITVFNTGPAELIVDSATIAGLGYTVDPFTSPIRLAPNASTTLRVNFMPPSIARRFDGTLTLVTNDPANPSVVNDFCGEGTPIGFRVLVLKADGTPYATVDQITLSSYGITPNTNTSVKNAPLVTITPPTSCELIRYHMEKALPASSTSTKRGSQYNLKVKVGNKAQSRSFTLNTNEFKVIVITLQ